MNLVPIIVECNKEVNRAVVTIAYFVTFGEKRELDTLVPGYPAPLYY
jgi:hypothetical protein